MLSVLYMFVTMLLAVAQITESEMRSRQANSSARQPHKAVPSLGSQRAIPSNKHVIQHKEDLRSRRFGSTVPKVFLQQCCNSHAMAGGYMKSCLTRRSNRGGIFREVRQVCLPDFSCLTIQQFLNGVRYF